MIPPFLTRGISSSVSISQAVRLIATIRDEGAEMLKETRQYDQAAAKQAASDLGVSVDRSLNDCPGCGREMHLRPKIALDFGIGIVFGASEEDRIYHA